MASSEPHTEPVLFVDIVEKVATITLNRPKLRNALNGELIAALDAAVKAVADDDAVKVVVITGAAADGQLGGFCSGGDRSSSRGSEGMELGVPRDALKGELARHDTHAAMLLHQMPKPTIAMVGGPAVGAGCSLAAACDLRFASPDAVFAANFTPIGLSGDYGGTFWWTRIAGTGVTRQLYLLNEKIDAERALQLGMVHAVVPSTELSKYTAEVAARLAKTPRKVLALVKDNLNQAEDEIERRRFLFANEADNQASAAKATMARVKNVKKAVSPTEQSPTS